MRDKEQARWGSISPPLATTENRAGNSFARWQHMRMSLGCATRWAQPSSSEVDCHATRSDGHGSKLSQRRAPLARSDNPGPQAPAAASRPHDDAFACN